MALDIHLMNVGSWLTLVISTKKYSILSTIKRKGSAFKKTFVKQRENNNIIQNTVDDIILQDKENVIMKDKTNKNIDYEVDRYELYELDKTKIGKK